LPAALERADCVPPRFRSRLGEHTRGPAELPGARLQIGFAEGVCSSACLCCRRTARNTVPV